MKFIDRLWATRERPQRVNPQLQERIAQYSVRAAWDVKAAPKNPPIRKGTK